MAGVQLTPAHGGDAGGFCGDVRGKAAQDGICSSP